MGANVSLFKKGLLLTAVPLLFQLIFIGLLLHVRGKAEEEQRWHLHTKEVIARAEATFRLLAEAQSAVRGYIISGDPAYTEPHKDVAAEFPPAMAELHRLVRDNSEQQARAEAIDAKATRFLEWLAETKRLAEGDPKQKEEAVARVRRREGKDHLDELRQDFDQFLEVEEGLDRDHAGDLERTWRQVNWLIGGGTAAAVFSAVFVAFAFGREISGRLGVVTANIQNLAEGKPLAPPLSGRDEIGRLDRSFRAMADSLEQADRQAREHAALLERQGAELAAANRELQNFAFVASHDLQEPLRKIQAFGDRLRAEHAGPLGERGRDYLGRVLSAAGRMRTLINDLLTFARVTTKAQPFAPVDLAEVGRDAVSDLEGRLHQAGGRVDLGPLPTLDADPVQMRQLLQNLIGNGLKFHRPGEAPLVTVRAEPLPPDEPRWPGVAADEPVCRLTVEDNGIGFDEKYLDRIFEVFQRLHGRNEYEGTGMGLAICRKIVERHRGQISARSRPGQGATFVVLLPYRQPQGETAACPKGESPSSS